MAKQIGLIKLKGTLGGITMYELRGKAIAKTQSSLSGVNTSPAFLNTRKNNVEFGLAQKLAKMVQTSLAGIVLDFYGLRRRIAKHIFEVIKADYINRWGERIVIPQRYSTFLIQNFTKTNIGVLFNLPSMPEISVVGGTIFRLTIPIKSTLLFRKPKNATHFEIIYSVRTYDMAALQVVFSEDVNIGMFEYSSGVPVGGVYDIDIGAVAGLTNPYYTIRNYQNVNGVNYLLYSTPSQTVSIYYEL